MQILKKATCPSLSGRTKISYEVGKGPDDKYALRLVKSSGGGFLSDDWISMADIHNALKSAPKPFSSHVLYGIFKGKSVNSPSFLTRSGQY